LRNIFDSVFKVQDRQMELAGFKVRRPATKALCRSEALEAEAQANAQERCR